MIHNQERFTFQSPLEDSKAALNWTNWERQWRQHPSFTTWAYNALDPTGTTNAQQVCVALGGFSANNPVSIDAVSNHWKNQPAGLSFSKEVPWTNLKFDLNFTLVPDEGSTPTLPVLGFFGFIVTPLSGRGTSQMKLGVVSQWYGPAVSGGQSHTTHVATHISTGPSPGRNLYGDIKNSVWAAGDYSVTAFVEQSSSSWDFAVYDTQYTVQEVPPSAIPHNK